MDFVRTKNDILDDIFVVSLAITIKFHYCAVTWLIVVITAWLRVPGCDGELLVGNFSILVPGRISGIVGIVEIYNDASY